MLKHLEADFFFFVFLGLHPWHIEVSRLGVELIFNSLSKARDRTHILMDTSGVLNPLTYNRNSLRLIFFFFFVFLFAIPWATAEAYGGSQARGLIGATASGLHHSHSSSGSKLCLWPTPQLTGNAGSLTHWARPGIKPETSWFLVGFTFAAPRQELQNWLYF